MPTATNVIKTGAFRDSECTCNCGNKHQLYGGTGYRTVQCDGWSDGKPDGGKYIHVVSCNTCGEHSRFEM